MPQTELSDFYMTNPISKASITMAKCVKSFEQRQNASKNQQQQQAVWNSTKKKRTINFFKYLNKIKSG